MNNLPEYNTLEFLLIMSFHMQHLYEDSAGGGELAEQLSSLKIIVCNEHSLCFLRTFGCG